MRRQGDGSGLSPELIYSNKIEIEVEQMSSYKDRYKSADDGLRFQDLVYQGNFKGMDPVPDGILGDKVLRLRA